MYELTDVEVDSVDGGGWIAVLRWVASSAGWDVSKGGVSLFFSSDHSEAAEYMLNMPVAMQ